MYIFYTGKTAHLTSILGQYTLYIYIIFQIFLYIFNLIYILYISCYYSYFNLIIFLYYTVARAECVILHFTSKLQHFGYFSFKNVIMSNFTVKKKIPLLSQINVFQLIMRCNENVYFQNGIKMISVSIVSSIYSRY